MLFLTSAEVLRLHAQLLAEFGGRPGILDVGALESALAAPQNRLDYEGANLAVCAATYAFHLTTNHPFADGNKRIGAAASELFLRLNGAALDASNDEIVELFFGIADGKLTRDAVENFFAAKTVSP